MEWNCKTVFIKTEEEEDIEILKQYAPKVLFMDEKRIKKMEAVQYVEYSDLSIDGDNRITDKDKYINTLNYLAELYILSRCTCLIGSKNGGLMGAIILNNKEYEHLEIIDKGVWE